MKLALLFFWIFVIHTLAYGAEPKCTCTCVTKDEEGKYTTTTASGKDRGEAGENLKRALKKNRCEISPDCNGSC